MHYKLLRIAGNSTGWQGPSGNRLGAEGFGDFVKETGFGHEDWNFDVGLEKDGYLLGYTAAQPKKELIGDLFGVIFAVYEAGAWYAVGCYSSAEYIEYVAPNERAANKMASDLFSLAQVGELSEEYREMTFRKMCKNVPDHFQYFNWKVRTSDVQLAQSKVLLPLDAAPNSQRMITPYDLTEANFLKIKAMIDQNAHPAVAKENEEDYAEGEASYRLHRARERNPKLVRDFKAQLTDFSCSVCLFDFEAIYGKIGHEFIECHHTKPVADMKPRHKTKIKDLAAVCSNCHRMIHRKNPPIDLNELRGMLRVKA